MFAPVPSADLRRRRAVLLVAAAIVLICLIGPARGLASVAQWTPTAADLTQTSRTCPSTATAVYYSASCWTVQQDQTNPFYWPQAPYPWAQCTYWAIEMRPDLWNNQSASDPSAGDWTAYTWPQHAALEGLTVDHVPAAGAIVVWPQSDDNSTGHVAYVQSVSVAPVTGNDLVTLQEMNDTTFDDPSQGQGDTMTMSMDAADLAGVQFIHLPAGVSVPSSPAAPTKVTTSTSPTATTPTRPTTTTKTSAKPTAATSATTTGNPGRTGTRTTKRAAVTAGKRSRPRLSVRLGSPGLTVSSASPAPLRATIQRLPSGTLVSRSRLRSGSRLGLATARYRVCVSQPEVAGWQSARACVSARASSAARVHISRIHTARVRPQALSGPTSSSLVSGLR